MVVVPAGWRPSKGSALALLLLHLAYAACLGPWLLFLSVSLMTFGSGGRQVALWLVAIFVGLYPLALLLTVVSSWAAHRRGQVRHAFRRNLLPLLWVVPMLALFVWANL